MSDTGLYHPAVKRSVTIAGHSTSIRLEPAFWTILDRESQRIGLPLNALVARIDSARLAVDRPPNLASAIRLWAVAQLSTDHSDWRANAMLSR